MTICALGEIFEIARGGSPRPIDQFFTADPDGVNWVLIGDAAERSKYIEKTKKRIKPSGVSRSRTVKPGDFLLTNSMSFGRPYIMKTSGCIHDGWLSLSPKMSNVDPNYFYYLLGSPAMYSEFERLAAGATVKNLNIDLVSGVRVLVPPLDEQRRIAAILDQADALRRKRSDAIAQVSKLKQAMFAADIGDLANWPSKKIGEICEVKGGKRLPKGEHYSDVPTPFRYIRVSDMRDGEIDPTQLLYLKPETQSQIRRYTLSGGDIMISIVGTIGQIAPIPDSLEGANLTENAAKLVMKRGVQYIPEFLALVLRSPLAQSQIAMRTGQVTIGKLALFRIEQILVPLPPLEIQKAFIETIRTVQPVEKQFIEHRGVLESLFGCLQRQAFNGDGPEPVSLQSLASQVAAE